MPIKILMPALSPTMTEGNLVKWHKKEGDQVKSGQLLAEIETDKATMEVEAVDDGTLAKILVSEGSENVKVNDIIAILAEKGEDLSSIAVFEEDSPIIITQEKSPEPIKTLSPQPSIISSTERVFATPLAKRIAKDKNINLNSIQGSGPRGRIIKADIEGYSPSSASVSNYVDQPISNMRKVIAKRLSESKQTIPHFYLTVECNISELLSLRTQINNTIEDAKISVNDFMIKAFAMSLHAIKEANVGWMETALRIYNTVDLSVAVSIEGGLITPIIRNAELKSLKEISLEMKELAQRARAGKLSPEEYQGGSMTISNLGMYGVDEFSAIINPPQSGILAIGKGNEKAICEKGEIRIASMLKATLSVDHRAIDGAVGAQLISKFKHYIENPLTLLL